MVRSGRPQSGHICPHECDTNNAVPILGANIEVLDKHSSSVWQTEQNDLDKKNKQNYWNHLKHIYEFWEEKYPEYYAVGVQALTEEELSDDDMFWWKNKHDLIYEGLNVQMVKAFLANRWLKLS